MLYNKLLGLFKRKPPLQKNIDILMAELANGFNGLSIQFIKRSNEIKKELESLPIEAVPYIKPYMKHENSWVRRFSGSALFKHYNEDILNLFLSEISKENPETHTWFTSLLLKTKDKKAIKHILNATSNLEGSDKKALVENLLKEKIKDTESIALLFIQQENNHLGIIYSTRLLAFNKSLSSLSGLWQKFDTEKKESILTGLLDNDEYCDNKGRLSILESALRDDVSDIAWKALNIIEHDDLKETNIKNALKSLIDHTDKRINSRSVDYIDIIDKNMHRNASNQ